MVWELEDGRFHATAFEVGLTLGRIYAVRKSNW